MHKLLHKGREAGLCLIVLIATCQATQAGKLEFSHSCDEAERLTIAAVGDLLFQEPLQRAALAPGGTYSSFWQPAKSLLLAADILYGNLEGPVANGVTIQGQDTPDPGRLYDGRVYGTVPILAFNYHPSLLQDLKSSGFAVLSTANNHALDRGPLGVERTVDNLRAAGIAFTGTRKKHEAMPRWSAITRRNGFAVAWLACTAWTNDRPDPYQQVLHCYRDKGRVLGEIAELSTDPTIDAVILTPHWGVEDLLRPLAGDRALAHMAINAGATAVIGTHPHVLQPWEKWVADDGREGLIIYSTGNFVSNHHETMRKSGVIAVLNLLKNRSNHRAVLSAASFVPTWVEFSQPLPVVQENLGDTEDTAAALTKVLDLLPAGNRIVGEALLQRRSTCIDKESLPAVASESLHP